MLRFITSRVAIRVISALILMLVAFLAREAKAQDSCPAGQTAKYKYKNSQYGGSGAPGNHPQNFSLFSSPSAAATANLVPSGTSQAGCVYAGSHSENYGTPPDYRYFQSCSGGGWIENGQEIRVEVVCVEGQQCQADLVGFWKYAVGGENPAAVCKENCRYDKAKERKVEVSGFATEYKANYTAVTPASCTIGGPTPEPGDIQATPGPTETPIGTHEPFGTAAEQGELNCGYINGEAVCLDEPTGNGTCTQLSSGAGFCVTDATPPDQPPKLPPENNDAPPLGTLTETSSDGTTTTTVTTNFYSNQQFTQSSNYGCQGGPCDEEEEQPPEEPCSGPDCQQCGAPGQPACRVKIDETGTPQVVPNYGMSFTNGIGNDFLGALNDQQVPDEFQEDDWLAFLPDLGYRQCFSIELFTFRGSPVVFPGAQGCQLLEAIKGILSYLIAGFTAFLLLRGFVDDIRGRTSAASS